MAQTSTQAAAQAAQSTAQAQQTHSAQETVAALETAAQEQTAVALTLAAQPTPTSTPTPPPPEKGCSASITETGRRMVEVPGGGRLKNSRVLPRGTTVEIIGRLLDRGWYQARHEGIVGWLRSDFVSLQSDCEPTAYDISYLLGNLGDNRLILDETFFGTENDWTDSEGEPIFPAETDYGDFQITLRTSSVEIAKSSNPQLSNLTDFELTTSFSRANLTGAGYVGVRFRVGANNYYEVRILRDCEIEVYATTEIVAPRKIDSGENTCHDEQEDFLVLTLRGYDLTVQLNDAEPFPIPLPDPDGRYIKGGIELVVENAVANFSYLVITAPR
jgi:hypothetical protein